MNHPRSKNWITFNSTTKVVNGDEKIMLYSNQSTYIPARHKHPIVHPCVIDLVMIEIQSGQYLGADAIVRFEDHCGLA
jgi:mannose-1-phosphate guanylyltransferase / mannose-6-phosphate isomerase